MQSTLKIGALGAAVLAVGWACAGSDNPTALDQINPEVEFDIEADHVEAYEQVEVHIHAEDAGMPMDMLEAHLEIQHHDGGEIQTVEMEHLGDAYVAHAMFFEGGEHHLRFSGMPESHRLMYEFAESEIDVHWPHREIGPYRIEFEVSPGRVLPGGEAHIHLIAHETASDAPASGLEMHIEVHGPGGAETHVENLVEEGAGEYEFEFPFEAEGTYEIHVEIEVNGVHQDGEFHLPVLSSPAEDADTTDDSEGDGHGHNHG